MAQMDFQDERNPFLPGDVYEPGASPDDIYRPPPDNGGVTGGRPRDPTVQPDFDLGAFYRSNLGRDPNENERTTDTANIGKYGVEAFTSDFLSKRPSNRPGSGTYGQVAQTSTPAFVNSSPQFSDPSARLVEDYALDRFRQRQNPDPNSGTALFEKYLRDYFGTLQGAPYSPTEEAQIKQTAYNAIEQERAATKQRWIEEVSRRGMLPSSGVALDGLRQIEEHYGRLRAESDNTYARGAIDLTRQNRAQAASVAGSLATNEEGRLSDALNYAMLPLSLQDRSFNQGLALTGAAGQVDNKSALGVLQMLQNANQLNSANRASSINAIMQYLASLYG